MTKEDYEFYLDNDCSTGEHVLTRVSLHDTIVDYANIFAAGKTAGFFVLVKSVGESEPRTHFRLTASVVCGFSGAMTTVRAGGRRSGKAVSLGKFGLASSEIPRL